MSILPPQLLSTKALSNQTVKRAKTNPSAVAFSSARHALECLFVPLVEYAVDSGISVRELNSLVRATAVRAVAFQQIETSRRTNISGIAAATGIPRNEISRILKTEAKGFGGSTGSHRHAIARIVTEWRDNPKFTKPNGAPADLEMYGRGATFESLVKNYGGGIPARAVFDEMARKQSIEMRPRQVVRLKTQVLKTPEIALQATKSLTSLTAAVLGTALATSFHPETTTSFLDLSYLKAATDALLLFRSQRSKESKKYLSESESPLSTASAHKSLSKKTAVRKRKNFSREKESAV